MKTVLDDLKSHKLILTEAVNKAEKRPFWRLPRTPGAIGPRTDNMKLVLSVSFAF